jgi:hypothetical protein
VEELRAWGIGMTTYHTRPWAVFGDSYKKIPVCVECHEHATGFQRARQRRRDYAEAEERTP